MDVRSGQLYPSEAAALEAGVPPEHVVGVEPAQGETFDIVRFTTGPFKGRCYERKPGGGLGRRRPELEASNPAMVHEQLAALERQLKAETK